jgi:hypothetical protein
MPSFDGLGLTAAQSQLAGFVFLISLGVFWAWNSIKGRNEKPEKPIVQINGEFADQSTITTLGKSIETLTMRMMQSAVAVDGMASQVADSSVALVNLAGLVEQMLVVMREQREEQELATERQRGYEEGRRDSDAKRRQQPLPRRTPPK